MWSVCACVFVNKLHFVWVIERNVSRNIKLFMVSYIFWHFSLLHTLSTGNKWARACVLSWTIKFGIDNNLHIHLCTRFKTAYFNLTLSLCSAQLSSCFECKNSVLACLILLHTFQIYVSSGWMGKYMHWHWLNGKEV